MKVHFISIGGSIMHNLAIAMKKQGHKITGSDDEIFEPARSHLKQHGLLPDKEGWDADKITKDVDVVVLGMHAKKDNPELQKARDLGLDIQSFPQLVYELSQNKQRIAIAGSHGKTTITSMVMHVMKKVNLDFDFLVGAKLKGFDESVSFSEDAPYFVIEADEYLSSPLDLRPKFLWYKPQFVLISGIAWDHINVFPSFGKYFDQFRLLLKSLPEKATVVYCSQDENVQKLINEFPDLNTIAYTMPSFRIDNDAFVLEYLNRDINLKIQGSHNLLNIEGARNICEQIGISPEVFYSAIQDFEGAGKRLELLIENKQFKAFKDFAHAPSKVKATVNGVHEQYPDKKIIAVLELHTYSSLNKMFLPHYAHTLENADEKIVFINPEAVKLKRLEAISEQDVVEAFKSKGLKVIFEKEKLISEVEALNWDNSILLLMSSGNFDGWDLNAYFEAKGKVKS